MKSIGVPTVQGMKGAFGNFLKGGAGGMVQGLGTAIFGNGIIGSIMAVVMAGSVMKGSSAEIIATVAGYEAGKGLFAVSDASSETSGEAVI